MSRSTRRYSSDLTDSEWEAIQPLCDWRRKRRYDLRRDILDALSYIAKTGCQSRWVPREFAPWTMVYCSFRGRTQTLISALHGHLHCLV